MNRKNQEEAGINTHFPICVHV